MKRALVLMVLGMMMSLVGWGQHFTTFYEPQTGFDAFFDVVQLNNGYYACVGRRFNGFQKEFLITLYTPNGVLAKQYSWIADMTLPNGKVIATSDGGFIVSGVVGVNSFLSKYNDRGDSVWTKHYISSPGIGYWKDIIEKPGGGYIICAGSIFNLDTNGDTIWTRSTGSGINKVLLTSNGSVLGFGRSVDSLGNSNLFGIGYDAFGNQIWRKNYGLDSLSDVIGLYPRGQDTIVVFANQRSTGYSNKLFATTLTSSGDSIAVFVPEIYDTTLFMDVTLTSKNTFLITGNETSWDPINQRYEVRMRTYCLNDNFDTLWSSMVDEFGGGQFGYSIEETQEGGMIICGQWADFYGYDGKAFLMKADSVGNVPYNEIRGRVVFDLDSNCYSPPLASTPLFNKSIVADNGNTFYSGVSNSQGDYSIRMMDIDTGYFHISLPNAPYWKIAPCVSGVSQPFYIGSNTINDLDIYLTPQILCPDLTVSINTPQLRRCFQSTYTLSYCNNGTLPANNPYIEIDFDQYLTIDSASIPWASNTGNLYRFNLDTLGIGQCGSFQVYVTVDCDSTELGQTHCVSAHIYPDSICLPPDPAWDGSSVAVSGSCDTGDTLDFTIGNTGAGDMTSPSFFLIAEDNVMYQSGNFQFLAGQDTTIRFKGNGSTFTLVANQVEGHPGHSFPMVSIEGCGTNGQGTFSKGFLTQYPQDDQDVFVDILCLQNVGSYDPNDKRPEPLGLEAEGYINATQPLDYTVRFQNTGTDTAFTVVIRDTLAPYLDITTLRLTGASHPYTFQIIGSNVLEWTFPNILLPDSNTNEPLSHGFVSFHISQTDSNAPGTQITNRAGIYFDFNPPVITNTTLNTVVEDYKTLFTFIQSPESKLQLGIYPNPNNGTFSLDFLAKTGATYEFAIYDLAGAKQFGQTLQGQAPYTLRPELPSGMYLYQLLENGQPVGMGKVVVSR